MSPLTPGSDRHSDAAAQGRDEITSGELLTLIEEQRRDDEIGHRRVFDSPLEILAGLNPWGWRRARPRYFRSGRKIIRRPQRITGVVCGTASMYRRGCRCEPCRAAQSERRKAQRAVAA